MTTRRLLCLVTDRRRLALTLGREEADGASLLVEQIAGAIRGGVDLVQIREPDTDAGVLAALVRRVMALAAGTRSRIVVNDRVDVAVAAAADGVHLREVSMPASAIRRAWPSLMIGRSVHSRDTVIRGDDVDYWIAGTVYPTVSKPSTTGLGVDGLREVVRAASGTPVLAIGGVTEGNLAAIVQAGAAGIAAIGSFLPGPEADDVAAATEKRVKTLRFAFDSVSAVS